MKIRYTKKCKLWFCDRTSYAFGLCRSHYTNLKRHGSPIAPSNRDMLGAIEQVQKLFDRGVLVLNGQETDSVAQISENNWELYQSTRGYRK